MKILQLLKHDLADERNKWARNYREIRKENPAKARELFRRLRLAMIEQALQDNLYYGRTH